MNQKRKEIINGNEVSEIRSYSLGGYEQKVLIEGKHKAAPILLFLHGGPGAPIPFSVGCRGLFPEMTDRMIAVYWDQLGSGINDYVIDDTFSVDNYVSMTLDLVRALKNDFPDNPINLFGVSWGSILAAKTAQKIPDEINRVVTYGQVLKELSYNEEVFENLEKSNMPAKKRKRLQSMVAEQTHTLSDLKCIMKWINKYTEGYQCKSGGKTPLGKILLGLMTSPDYSLKNFKAIVINGTMKNKSLLTEVMNVDISDTLHHIKNPYLVLQGSTDIVTSTRMIKSFVTSGENNNLKYNQIEDSGHMPSGKGMEKIIELAISFMLCNNKLTQ